MFVYFLINNKQDSISNMMDDYRSKSAAWAEDFNRQFVTIDVKYIVFGTIILFMIIGFFFGWMIGGFMGVFVFLALLALGGVVSIRIPASILETLKRSRGVKVNKQLMDALILLSNSLRSGMDIVQGFEMVSKDLLPPIADEFGLVVKNYRLGTPFEQALDGMVSRVDSRMLAYIVKAIIIQRQVGGNLPVIFARLVENIREESKLEEKLQAMTAQQRIQSIVVSVMPFIMMMVMFVFNPTQMISFYTSPIGMVIFLFCVVWIFIGMQVLKKLGNIRV
jgi:tight adherence protein B